MEEHLRDINFSRISVTNQCLTIKGMTFSLATGFGWDYVYNDFEELDDNKQLEIIFSENLPTSHM